MRYFLIGGTVAFCAVWYMNEDQGNVWSGSLTPGMLMSVLPSTIHLTLLPVGDYSKAVVKSQCSLMLLCEFIRTVKLLKIL